MPTHGRCVHFGEAKSEKTREGGYKEGWLKCAQVTQVVTNIWRVSWYTTEWLTLLKEPHSILWIATKKTTSQFISSLLSIFSFMPVYLIHVSLSHSWENVKWCSALTISSLSSLNHIFVQNKLNDHSHLRPRFMVKHSEILSLKKKKQGNSILLFCVFLGKIPLCNQPESHLQHNPIVSFQLSVVTSRPAWPLQNVGVLFFIT